MQFYVDFGAYFLIFAEVVLTIFWVFWDLFRLWHMKYEAFHFEKSFEHGPKASKQLNYIVFNDFIDISMSKIMFFQKNIENQF